MMQRPRFTRTNVLVLALAAGCLSADEHTYTPEQDMEAMAALESTWTQGNVTLSLCENLERDDVPDGCQVEHVLHRDGRIPAHSEETGGGGCGGHGCPAAVEAWLKGTLDRGDGVAVAVEGRVGLYGRLEGDPYAFPYEITLQCTDPSDSCTVSGTLEADGTLRLDLPAGTVNLARAAAAACP